MERYVDSEIQELLTTCKEKMFLHIMTDKYSDLFEYHNCKLTTIPVDIISRKDDDEYIELNVENKALLKIFERIFGIWEAGRNKEATYKTLYAFPQKDDRYSSYESVNLLDVDEDYIPINKTEESVKKFVSCLAGRAKTVKLSSSALNAANRSRFFIVGDVGSGKTTFINYIFSKYYNYFNSQNIMWIRVDLTKLYHNEESLSVSLKYQLARIFRKYYEEDIFGNEKFIKTLEEEFEPLRVTKKIDINEMEYHINNYLKTYSADYTQKYHDAVLSGVSKYVSEKYSCIYVFDGLDKIYSNDSFQNHLNEVRKHILGSEKIKHVFLFVMRTISHAGFLQDYLLDDEGITLASLRKVSKVFIIEPPKLRSIVDNRLKLFCQQWEQIFDEERYDIINSGIDENDEVVEKEYKIAHSRCMNIARTDVINAFYDIFLRYIYRGLSLTEIDEPIHHWERSKAYSALKNVVGENFRVLMDALSALHKCFLQTIQELHLSANDIVEMSYMLESQNDEYQKHLDNLRTILRKHYRVTSVLLKNKKTYLHPCYYVYDDNKKIKMKVRDKQSTYIYNIFSGTNIVNTEGEVFHLLSKVRILQLLSLSGETAGSICNFLCQNFGYNNTNIEMDLTELLHMQMVKLVHDTSNITEERYKYEITRVGKNILNTLIYEYSYLRTILDGMLVPAPILSYFLDNPATNIRKSKTLLHAWHIPRVSKFIGLIHSVETQEKEVFSLVNDPNNFDKWKIASKIMDNVVKTVEAIIKGVTRNKQQAFIVQLNEIISKI